MEIKGRLIWTLFILVFFFILAGARLGYIQVVRGEQYARMAMAGETLEVSLEDYSRGQVLDRNLQPLTGTYNSNRVVIFPDLLDDPDSVASGISRATGAEFHVLRDMLSGRKPVMLPFKITGEQSRSIEEQGWDGVLVVPYSIRYGPRPLAVHMVGHLGRIRDLDELEHLARANGKTYSLSDWTGRQGIEYFYERELKGQYSSGMAVLYTDAMGKRLPGLPLTVHTGLPDSCRSDVVTTIDAGIQGVVESVMDRYVKKGAVVVMETSSGDILAMASRPSYSPDPAYAERLYGDGDERFINQSLMLFQPGSIFKVVVAVAALSEGVADLDTRFTCLGHGDKPVRCWYGEGHGSITFAEAFAQSCNPAFVSLGRQLGPQKIISYARAMGLDNQTVIGYPVAHDRRQNLDLVAGKYNLANSSVGQGPLLASPLQITAMVNSVAGGGLYVQPRLVREIRPSRGSTVKIPAFEPVRVISPEIAARVGQLMEMVTRQGVGRKAWVPGGGAAGKTGSAQLAESGGAVNAWFSGYGPLDKPRYTVTVLVREGVSGGETAAPVFREIMEELLKNRIQESESRIQDSE
ncbi:MAG: peptidoglycan D,D-transpeptidase FtsI family protein [Bacillota bacterium]